MPARQPLYTFRAAISKRARFFKGAKAGAPHYSESPKSKAAILTAILQSHHKQARRFLLWPFVPKPIASRFGRSFPSASALGND
jgi:hypothetical protein